MRWHGVADHAKLTPTEQLALEGHAGLNEDAASGKFA